MTRLAVIANGAPPETPGERAALAACDGCVCCDRLPPPGAPPLLQVVGDGDTLREAVPPGLLFHEDEQETCDLANLAHIYETATEATLFANDGRFDLFPTGEHTLDVRPGGAVSLISLRPQRVTAHGLVWPVEDLLLASLWRATLNRAKAPTLRLRCEAPLFVYRPWDP